MDLSFIVISLIKDPSPEISFFVTQVHPSKLMKKLCADLKIPVASSANNQYYGYNSVKINFSGLNIEADVDQDLKEIYSKEIKRSVPLDDEYPVGERTEQSKQDDMTGTAVGESYVNDSFDSDTVDDIDEEHVDSDWWAYSLWNSLKSILKHHRD